MELLVWNKLVIMLSLYIPLNVVPIELARTIKSNSQHPLVAVLLNTIVVLIAVGSFNTLVHTFF
jgi:hypothetical protein